MNPLAMCVFARFKQCPRSALVRLSTQRLRTDVRILVRRSSMYCRMKVSS